ncbi:MULTISPECIES: acetone carboxylase subunit gamma [unclassified Roseiflexus]|jgi:acetone carboxylase gamma subunit|uniref:acetone carboxylase subunit gamma n=1 Tax=unclassified Roseiflexus TaxID=2609473 RepID=UPI0000D813FD|nr:MULTISPECIES: acetone carboxylase subunit gamma [unclassified Roseiflexus]ABQ90475.1 acetone carboxylase, gamma subunit [Roseiflexus sp. RS-1]MBO9342229.1 acetone carboxylase subunit gamma [Roseiflexus sp.]MCL6539138.1 acetone carboxylase subunit gamma [Roseiflexus sp.]
MTHYDKSTIADLVDGRLEWSQLKAMMSNFKDPDRFDKYIAVLQERVPWDDQILLPLGPHLFIVRKADGSIVTKSRSGYEFGDYRQNWKLKARIRVRDTDASLQELYPAMMHCTPGWMELREYIDPLDGTLLEVEAVPPGYPVVHSFQPDLETFYREWLGRSL